MSANDAVHCPHGCEDDKGEPVRLGVVQGGFVAHEGRLLYWRRKRCPKCRGLTKTVEVPVDAIDQFRTPLNTRGLY